MKYQEYKELSDAMEQAAHKFYQLRYQMSNGGNLSMRAPGHDWMLVKATDVAFDEVCADTIVVTDFDGIVISGSEGKRIFGNRVVCVIIKVFHLYICAKRGAIR